MILAAGKGTRLGVLGRSVPKILLDIGGETLLMRHLRYLESAGVRRVVVNAHHLADQVQQYVASYRGPLEVDVIVEPNLLGTAGAVRNALPLLGGEAFLVLYGDIVIGEPLTPIVRMHRAKNAMVTLTAFAADSTVGKGVVRLRPDGRVYGFAEKQQEGPGLVNAGLYVIDPSLVAALEPGVPLDFGHDVLPNAVSSGETVVAHVLRQPVIDVGTLEGLERAQRVVAGDEKLSTAARRGS